MVTEVLRRRRTRQWARGGFVLFLATWAGSLSGATAAAPPRGIEARLRAGEERDVVVDLGQDSRPDLDFVARLIPSQEEVWRKGLLSLSLVDAGFLGSTEQRLPHNLAGRRLRLRASARLCSPAGEYGSELEIAAINKLTDHPAGAPERIPILLRVEAGPSCAAVKTRAGGLALLVVLVGLYVRQMFFRSSFLSPELLAGGLQPLRWNASGLTEGAGLNLGRYWHDQTRGQACDSAHSSDTADQRKVVLMAVLERDAGADLQWCIEKSLSGDGQLRPLLGHYRRFDLNAMPGGPL